MAAAPEVVAAVASLSWQPLLVVVAPAASPVVVAPVVVKPVAVEKPAALSKPAPLAVVNPVVKLTPPVTLPTAFSATRVRGVEDWLAGL